MKIKKKYRDETIDSIFEKSLQCIENLVTQDEDNRCSVDIYNNNVMSLIPVGSFYVGRSRVSLNTGPIVEEVDDECTQEEIEKARWATVGDLFLEIVTAYYEDLLVLPGLSA